MMLLGFPISTCKEEGGFSLVCKVQNARLYQKIHQEVVVMSFGGCRYDMNLEDPCRGPWRDLLPYS